MILGKISILLSIFYFINVTFINCQNSGTIIPLYIYPQRKSGCTSASCHNWSPLFNAQKRYPSLNTWAIVNVYNGPGNTKNADYSDSIPLLNEAGVKTMGYVHTTYGNRSESLVKEDIDNWKQFYSSGVNGIFFDEMAYEENKPELVEYYRRLGEYAKQAGFNYTVGNPGTDTKPEYVGTLDTIVIYEGNGLPTRRHLNSWRWHNNYPKNKWATLSYSTNSIRERDIRSISRSGVGFIFATNGTLPNPWNTLPSYLNDMFQYLSRT